MANAPNGSFNQVIEEGNGPDDTYLVNLDVDLASLDVLDPELIQLVMGDHEPGRSLPSMPEYLNTADRRSATHSSPVMPALSSQDQRIWRSSENGELLMALGTAIIMLLPMALLYTFALALPRMIRFEANGSVFVLMAIAMGILSLGALAFI